MSSIPISDKRTFGFDEERTPLTELNCYELYELAAQDPLPENNSMAPLLFALNIRYLVSAHVRVASFVW